MPPARIHPLFHLSGILSILSSLILFPVVLPAPAYLKIGDIKGESTDKNHVDWIEVLSFDNGVEIIEGSTQGQRQHKPFVISKPIDKATPLLMEAMVQGTSLEDIVLEVDRPFPGTDGTGIVYYLVRISDGHLTDHTLTVPDSPTGDHPQESITLAFSYAEWHVRQIGEGGTIIDSASTYFDAFLNEGGELSPAPLIQQVGNQQAGTSETLSLDIIIEDSETPLGSLEVEASSGSLTNTKPPTIIWTGEVWRLTLETTPIASGQTPITVTASNGVNTRSMSFSLYVDSMDEPFAGFMKAYFSEEELLDPAISSPIADPDGDLLPTLLEFLLGTNPQEYTPPEEQFQMSLSRSSGPEYGEIPRIHLKHLRRIDDPRIRLALYGSVDGRTWTQLTGARDNPLYEESTQEGTNPLYESVSGTVTPPGEAGGNYFLRFVAEMD